MRADRLYRYVFEDNRRRVRDDRISLFIALVVSAVSLAVGARPETASIIGCVLLAICMSYFAIQYSMLSAKLARVGALRQASFLYRPVSRRIALVSGVCALIICALPEAAMAAVERRLRRLAANAPLNQGSLAEVASLIDEATRYRIKLRPDALEKVASALQETAQASPILSAETISVGAKMASTATLNLDMPRSMNGKVFSSLPEARQSRWDWTPIATNTGPDNYAPIGFARKPYIAQMRALSISEARIDDGEVGPAFLLTRGLTASLDGYLLEHVVFQDMLLIYHGGPVVMKEVYFVNCKFQFDATHESWRLIKVILNGGWISFSSEHRSG